MVVVEAQHDQGADASPNMSMFKGHMDDAASFLQQADRPSISAKYIRRVSKVNGKKNNNALFKAQT